MRIARRLLLPLALVAGALATLQWGLPAVTAGDAPEPWALLRVQAPRAAAGLARVVVGVVDSGVDASHPDLKDRVLLGIDLVDGGPGTNDPFGHGTQVAGIIASGELGVAQNALILPVRVLDAQGAGTTIRLAEGIRWAADHDARVINASVETDDRRQVLKAAVAYSWSRNSVVVAISGNQGGGVQWPAAYGHALAVGATDQDDRQAAFSGQGSELDLVAPGVGITTTAAGGGYAKATGTSAAAPFVSGAVALLLGQEPELTNADLVRRLRATARDLGRPGPDDRYGAGLLDIAAALEA